MQRIGRMTLNRNPDNFFAETEQVAFHPGHVVPGIDFSNDPLLQGRLFSYTDTQLIRLGGPNSHQLPINRAICPFHNNQRDGHGQEMIPTGRVSYEPSSIDGGSPREATAAQAGFASHAETIDASKIRQRSESFADHFSQATLFWNSQSEHERDHIVAAFQFELAKVVPAIRARMATMLMDVDALLARRVAEGLGLAAPLAPGRKAAKRAPAKTVSAALSMAGQPTAGIATRKIAILAADGVDVAMAAAMKAALVSAGAKALVIAPRLGTLRGINGKTLEVDHTIATMPSVVFDGVFIPGGAAAIATLRASGDATHFVMEAFKHCKAIAAMGEGTAMLDAMGAPAVSGASVASEAGIVLAAKKAKIADVARDFVAALASHRHWTRAGAQDIPA